MIHTRVTIICGARDGPDSLCGSRVSVATCRGEGPGVVAVQAIEEAFAAGWRKDGDRWICPKRHEPALEITKP